jgi:hypothetical protein
MLGLPTAEAPALPDRSDVDRLKLQVDDLARVVEQLLQERGDHVSG